MAVRPGLHSPLDPHVIVIIKKRRYLK
jgi:hypothetical protein